jgi:hypothetical protein
LELKFIINDQYGLKRGHSTTHALLRKVDRITRGFNNNKDRVVLFLDTEREFNNVWITGLIAKLIEDKTTTHAIHIIYDYLQNRSFSVMHRSSYSSPRPIKAEVPQCSLFGPTLFNIYINDIPSVQNDSNIAISVYADDINISVRSGSIDIAIRKLHSATDF